jgi:YbbR domain-containing protein
MDKWLKTPWFIRVVSLLLAVGLYVSVSVDKESEARSDDTFFGSSDDVVTINSVPLEVEIDQEKYVVQNVPPYVDVTIEGSKSLVTSTSRQRSFDVFIDLTDLEAGTHDVQIQHQGISNQLNVTIQPETISVTIEERGTEEFDVEVELLNKTVLNEGLLLGDATISPSTVSVTGSKSEVAKVAMVKAIVDLEGVTNKIDMKNAPVKVYDQEGNELNVYVSPTNVHVKIPLIVGQKDVPISYTTIGELPEGISLQSITLETGAVSVFGQEAVLNALTTIDGLVVDLSTINEDKTIELNVPVPPGATKVDPSTVNVVIDVEETSQKTFEEIPIEVIGLEEDREITFIDPEEQMITIIVFGTEQQLEEITAEDFKASIDVSGFFEGEFEREIIIEGPEELQMTLNYNNARVRIE